MEKIKNETIATFIFSICFLLLTTPVFVAGNPALTQMNQQLIHDDLGSGFNTKFFGISNLSSPLGHAMSALVNEGENISFNFNIGNGVSIWNKYTWDGTSWNVDNETPQKLDIFPTTGAQFQINNLVSTHIPIRILDYDANAPITVPPQIIKKDYNLLAIPFGFNNFQVSEGQSNTGLMDLVGDMMTLRRAGAWISLRRLSLTRWVRSGTSPANEVFPEGSLFWFVSRSEEDYNWTIPT